MVKGLIFDLDGTLINTLPDLSLLLNTFLTQIGIDVENSPVTDDMVRKFIGNGPKKTLERAINYYNINNYDEKQLDDWLTLYMTLYNEKPFEKALLWKGVPETLAYLDAKKYKMAVCTNKPDIPTLSLLSHFNIKDYFYPIVTSETIPFLKPAKEVTKFVLDKIGLQASDCVMIGDSVPDVQMAHNMEMPAWIVRYGYEAGDLSTIGADKIIDNFADLKKIL